MSDLERCPCGKWFKNRTDVHKHGEDCEKYKVFLKCYEINLGDSPQLSWKDYKEIFMEELGLPENELPEPLIRAIKEKENIARNAVA
jgi:hypothetical protein